MERRLLGLVSLAVLGVLFVALNVVSAGTLRSARLDLTQSRLYTLDEGSKRIARGVSEPVRLTLYQSARLSQGRPVYQSYGRRVRELLEEFARLNSNITLTVIDPEPFSETEDQAAAAGLRGLDATGDGQKLFLGLVGTNSVNGREVIPFFDPANERFLEYDVAKVVSVLANPTRKVVGLLSSLPLKGGQPTMEEMMAGMTQGRPAWAIYGEMAGLFDVRALETTVEQIPAEVQVLVLVHPKNLSDQTLYAIDQFVLRGGRLLAFVDPFCESDTSGNNPQNPMAGLVANKASDLSKLLNAWGVEIVSEKIAGDTAYAIPVTMPGSAEPTSYVAWMTLKDAAIAKDDPITGQLSQVNVATAGIIRAKGPAEEKKAGEKSEGEKKSGAAPAVHALKIQPLLTTSSSGSEINLTDVQFRPDPRKLLSSYLPGTQPLVVAARLSGRAATAFPDGPPPLASSPIKPHEGEAAPAPAPAPAVHGAPLKESSGEVNIVLVADADMLADRFWVQQQQLGQMVLRSKIADNGDLAVNAIDALTGESALMGLRARGQSQRPFDKIVALRKAAEQRFVAEQTLAETKVRDAQTRLDEEQRKRGASGELTLTSEQQEMIRKLSEDLAQSRRQLREVKRNLNKDIDDLGTRVKFVNIGLMPALVALTALGLGLSQMLARSRAARGESGRRGA